MNHRLMLFPHCLVTTVGALFCTLLLSLTALSQPAQPQAAVREVMFGNVVDTSLIASPPYRRVSGVSPHWIEEQFRHLFNYATTGNAFKWREMEPVRGQVDYSKINAIVNWAQTNGITLKGHTLVWGNQGAQGVPSWLENLPKDEVEALLEARVREVVGRYTGRVDIWDVLNEPLHETWFEFIPDYAIKVFQWAREANPEALLLINEFDVLSDAGAREYANYVRYLVEKGAPIDAIGIQAHISEPIDVEQLRRALDILASVGLPLHITELSIPSSGPMGRQGRAMWSEAEQAAYLRAFCETAMKHPAVEAITLWGLWDGNVWRDTTGLIAVDGRAKPAMAVLEELLAVSR